MTDRVDVQTAGLPGTVVSAGARRDGHARGNGEETWRSEACRTVAAAPFDRQVVLASHPLFASGNRTGFVGCGREATTTYLPVFHGLLRVPCAATDPEARTAPVPLYPSVGEMLSAEKPNLLVLCADPATNSSILRQAPVLGVSVLCEKPVLMVPGEFASLVERMGRNRQVLRLVDNWLYSSQIRALLSACRSCFQDVAGSLLTVSLSFQRCPDLGRDGGWRCLPSSGGPLWDYGWHALYLLDAILSTVGRAPPASCMADNFTVVHDSTTAAAVRLDVNRVQARIDIDLEASSRRTRVSVSAGDTAVELGDDFLQIRDPDRGTRSLPLEGACLSHADSRRFWLAQMLMTDVAEPDQIRQSCQRALTCSLVLTKMRPLADVLAQEKAE